MKFEKRGFQARNFVFGLMMGAADVVPGVSGGTMALIVGIYERLIASVRGAAAAPVYLLRGDPGTARGRLSAIEWGLVLPLVAGILTAIVIGARLIVPVMEGYPVQFRAVFFGLIAGSLVIPWGRRETHRASHYWAAAAAGAVAFALVGIPPREIAEPALIFVFLAASIAICAMILPGISGAYLLLVMGMYGPTLRALNGLDLAYVGVFVLGAAVGLGGFSRVLHYLLTAHHDLTMAALVGLMAGSLRALWPYQDDARTILGPPSLSSFLVVLALASVGFIFVTAIARAGAAIERREAEQASRSVDTPANPI